MAKAKKSASSPIKSAAKALAKPRAALGKAAKTLVQLVVHDASELVSSATDSGDAAPVIAKKSSAKKSSAKKSTAKKTTAKKTTAKKSSATKTTAKKSTAKKSTAKKTTAKKTTAKKSTAKKKSGKKSAKYIR